MKATYDDLRTCTTCETEYEIRCPVKGSRTNLHPKRRDRRFKIPKANYSCPACLLRSHPSKTYNPFHTQVVRFRLKGLACPGCPNYIKCMTIGIV
jgi:hypothetical protein